MGCIMPPDARQELMVIRKIFDCIFSRFAIGFLNSCLERIGVIFAALPEQDQSLNGVKIL
jgi:hypothetical protein